MRHHLSLRYVSSPGRRIFIWRSPRTDPFYPPTHPEMGTPRAVTHPPPLHASVSTVQGDGVAGWEVWPNRAGVIRWRVSDRWPRGPSGGRWCLARGSAQQLLPFKHPNHSISRPGPRPAGQPNRARDANSVIRFFHSWYDGMQEIVQQRQRRSILRTPPKLE